jgi:transposase
MVQRVDGEGPRRSASPVLANSLETATSGDGASSGCTAERKRPQRTALRRIPRSATSITRFAVREKLRCCNENRVQALLERSLPFMTSGCSGSWGATPRSILHLTGDFRSRLGRLEGSMAILSDAVWRRVTPCLPVRPRRQRGPGRRRIDDRGVLAGILFVLKSGIPWEELPAEMGCGSGMTCWRRLREWQRTGTWSTIRRTLEASLPPREFELFDWTRAAKPRSAARPPAVRSRVSRSRPGGRVRRRSGGSGSRSRRSLSGRAA